jgi:hypothetical protein
MSGDMMASSAQQQSTKAGGHGAQPAKLESTKLEFEVIAGVHRGVALTLDKADYCIGRSPQSHIVLSDPGIAPEHAVLRDEGATVRIDATGGDVSVERKLIPQGYGCRVRLPADVALGEARLHLSRPARQRSNTSGSWLVNKPIALAGALICLALSVTAVALGLPQMPKVNGVQTAVGDANVAADLDVTSATAAARRKNGSGIPSAATAAQAARELNARLDAANIRALRVTTIDGRLAVSGKLPKAQTLEWTTIQQWFDQTYGSRIVLTANVTDDGGRAMPTLGLQAIWYGDHPYIITAQGERYYQGAVLDNGWIIREIAADRLLLAKGGDTVALTY